MTRSNNTYPPLLLLKNISAQYPEVWDLMERFHAANGVDLQPWPQWCYVPMAAPLEVARRVNTGHDPVTLGQQLAALAPWRISKEAYVFDPDMEQLLYEQADDLEIPGEILLQLPYPCFYVETSALEHVGERFSGMLVHLEYDANNHDRELRLLFLRPDGSSFGVPVHIDDSSVSESMQRMLSEAHSNARSSGMAPPLMDYAEIDAFIAFLSRALQLVLYICASNADIGPSPEQALITRRSPTIKDRYAEIRKWDVGFRIGSAVRAHREAIAAEEMLQSAEHNGSQHKAPRPHMRRGHWHHYWVGSKKTDSQRLVLRWVAPIAVGASTRDGEAPVVIHKIQAD